MLLADGRLGHWPSRSVPLTVAPCSWTEKSTKSPSKHTSSAAHSYWLVLLIASGIADQPLPYAVVATLEDVQPNWWTRGPRAEVVKRVIARVLSDMVVVVVVVVRKCVCGVVCMKKCFVAVREMTAEKDSGRCRNL